MLGWRAIDVNAGWSLKRYSGQPLVFADEAIDGTFDRAVIRIGRHPIAKRQQLLHRITGDE